MSFDTKPPIKEPRWLNVVYDAPIPGIKGNYLKLVDLGAPNRRKLRDNLLEFLKKGDNCKYVLSWRNCLPLQYKFLIQDIQAISSRFVGAHGNYEDYLVGITNIFQNLEEILKSPDITQCDVTNPRDCVVVGGGPSLDLEIDNLRKIYEDQSCLIISCDSSIKRLLAEGIKPHMVVTAERTEGTEKYFQGIKAEDIADIPLVASMVTYYPTLLAWNGPKMFFWRRQREIQWLPFTDRKFIVTAPQVMQACIGIAHFFGSRNIALIGSDLCFHPETQQSHANLETTTNAHERHIKQEKTYEVPGNTYEKVVTDINWDIFAEDLRAYSKILKVVPFNTSKLGRKIDGIPYVPLDEWMQTVTSDKVVFNRLTKNRNKKKELKKMQNVLTKALSHIMNCTTELNKFKESIAKYKYAAEILSGLCLRKMIFCYASRYKFPSKAKQYEKEFKDEVKSAQSDLGKLIRRNIKIVKEMKI